jgi:hypothetical protein
LNASGKIGAQGSLKGRHVVGPGHGPVTLLPVIDPEIENLFLVSFTLGQLPVVITQRIYGRAPNGILGFQWFLEKRRRDMSHVVHQVIKPMALQPEKAVVPAGSIQRCQCNCIQMAQVDGRYTTHI